MKTFGFTVGMNSVKELTLEAEDVVERVVLNLLHKLYLNPRMLDRRDVEYLKGWIERRYQGEGI